MKHLNSSTLKQIYNIPFSNSLNTALTRIKLQGGYLPKLTFSFLLGIMLTTSITTNGATITSLQSGQWGVGTTWIGGIVPGATDSVIIASGHTVTTNTAVTQQGVTIINSGGILANGTKGYTMKGALNPNLIVNGTFLVSVRFGLTFTGSGAPVIQVNSGGVINFNTTTATSDIPTWNLQSGSTIILSAPGAQTLSSVLPATTFSNLTFSGSGAKSITVAATVNNVLSMEGTASAIGTPTYGNSSTIQYKGTGSFTTSNNEFPATFAGSGGVIIDQGTGNTVTLNANKTGIAGDLNIKSGTLNLSTFTANRSAEGGTLTIASGASLKIGGTNTFPSNYSTHNINCTSTTEYSGANQTVANLNSSQSYGNLTLSGSGTKTLQTGTTAICNNFTITGTANTTGAVGLTIGGNVLIDATALFIAGVHEHSVAGNWTKTGTFNAAGSTINFNGSTTQNIGTSSFNHITFSNTGIKTATGVLTIAGDVTINSNFNTGNFNHSVAGNWTNNGTFTAGTGTITLNAITAKSIGGTANSQFNNLIINETGSSSLGITTTITGTLTLTKGLLDIGTYTLTTGSISGGNSTSYVKTSSTGRLKRMVTTGGTVFLFPVGNSAYNPISFSSSAIGNGNSDYFSIRVEDGALTNTNANDKTINRKWYLMCGTTGVTSLTVAPTYNSGETGASFNRDSTKIGFFTGTAWGYGPATVAGTDPGPFTVTASGTAPDATNPDAFIAIGSEDAFSASKFSITVLPPTPYKGVNSSIATVQSQNSMGVPTWLLTTTTFDLTSNMDFERVGGLTGFAINAGTHETVINNIKFLESTWSEIDLAYINSAIVTATPTLGETLAPGITPYFAILDGSIYRPTTSGDWSTVQWQISSNGGNSWRDTIPPTNNTFSNADVIQIPSDITLTANVPASFYSLLLFGTLDINSSGALTVNHSTDDSNDYNIQVYGTLKNSGGILTNSNPSYTSVDVNGGTYWHNMNGGSIPIANWKSLNGTPSICKVTGITATAITAGLNQNFQNFIWDNVSQAATQTLTNDLVVRNTLTLANGVITTNDKKVIVEPGGTTESTNNSRINGNIRIHIPTTTSPTINFPIGDSIYYTPLSVAFTGTIVGSGYLDAYTSATQPPLAAGLSQTKYIKRIWTVSNTNISGFSSFNTTFTFADADKVGNPDTAALVVRKLDNNVWAATSVGVKTANTTECTDMTSFSSFAIGEDDCTANNYVWMGGTNSDWNTASNWCYNQVPADTVNVTIPADPTNQPVIGAADGSCKNLTISNGASLTITGSNSLSIKGSLTNSGTFTTNSSSVSFNGTLAQTITGVTTFYNLTVNNASGVTSSNNLTVNGTLHLQSANASVTAGALDMGSNTLNMGTDATTTGTGDVTGIVRRQQTFVGNTAYSFGNQNTSIVFTDFPDKTKPTWISCKIVIGSTPSWRTTGIKRYYSFAIDGGNDRTAIRLHYLDSELDASEPNETELVLWDAHNEYPWALNHAHGKSNFSPTDNWIGLTGMSIQYIAPSNIIDNKQWGLAYSNVPKKIWTGFGAEQGDWSLPDNWEGGIPTIDDDVLIPAGCASYPTKNLNPTSYPVVAKTIEIENGASLTVDNYDITVSGAAGAWLNNGTFVPGTGKVTFNHNNTSDFVTIGGINNFYNLEIGSNTVIRPNIDSYIGISGTLYTDPTSILELTTTTNTFEFKGAASTILNPVGLSGKTGYYNLILSNSGIITFPTQLNVTGNLTVNTTTNATTNNSTLVLNGNTAQTISGSSALSLQNLTINNAAGVIGSTNMTVNGALVFISDNPSSNDKGALAMSETIILNMGPNSTTSGSGDVSGTINRSHTFNTATFYSFGNQNNGLTFASVSGYPGQTLPSSVSLKVYIGTAPNWSANQGAVMTNPIKRYYDIYQTGGAGTRALMQVHYRDNELPDSISKNQLTIWTSINVAGTFYNKESGKSGYDTNLNFVTIQDVDFAKISSIPGDFKGTLAPSSNTNLTWIGTVDTDWDNVSNWTPNGIPDATRGVIIPNTYTTPYAPTLPESATCKSIQINTGGVLNAAASGGTLTLTAADAAWSVEAGGIFNANTSTVIFSANAVTLGNTSIVGNTNFHNITVGSGVLLRPAANSYIGITGTLTNNGTLEAATTENNIEFNGTSTQNIPNPNGSSPGYHNLILSGTGTKNLPETLNIVTEFTNNTVELGTVNAGSGTVIFDGNSIGGQLINGITSTLFNNLTINNPVDAVTVLTPISVDGTLNITTGSVLNVNENDLSGGISNTAGSGTLFTQSTSLTPLTSGKTWNFHVIYNGASAQTAVSGTYNDLTVDNSEGVKSGDDITVNGILNLQSSNPTSTLGTFSTESFTLNMGANSTTIGVGDVTGKVKRTHTFITSQAYSFGNQATNLTFMGISGLVKPNWVSCVITIGTEPGWKAGGVMRTYNFAQNGTGTDKVVTTLHYLDSELNNNSESKIVFWDHHSDATINEHGKSNNDIINNWISLSGLGIAYLAPTTDKQWALFNSSVAKNTWLGTGTPNNKWDLPDNWSKGHYPGDQDHLTDSVLIPAGAPNYPTLTSAVQMSTLEIESGALLTADSYNVTISGHTGAWMNNGTFTSTSGSVIFSHGNLSDIVSIAGTNNNFYNLVVNPNTNLEPSTDCYMKISGFIIIDATSVMNFKTNKNTVEFNGGDQTLTNLSGNGGYHDLVISGTGIKTLPGQLNIAGNFTNNGAIAAGTGTVIMKDQGHVQNIGGTTSTTFYNLTIDNSNQVVTASADFNVLNTFTVNGNTTMDMTTAALGGTFTTTGTGTLKTQSTSATSLPSGRTWVFNVIYNNTSSTQTVPTGTYTSLQVSNPISVTASGALNCTKLTIDNGAVLDMSTFTLTGGSTISSAGTLKTKNTTTTPIPIGKTWDGVVIFNGSATQSLPEASTFNNLAVDNAAGVIVRDFATANGTLLINSGKKLTIPTNAKMTANQVTNNAGVSGLVIKANSNNPNGTLIFYNAPSSPVLGTVEMFCKATWDLSNLTPGGKYKWQFFGIPVTDIQASPIFNGNYVRLYNEAGTGAGSTPDKRWILLTTYSHLSPFLGYEITEPAAKTYSFQGQLVNSDFSTTLPYTPDAECKGQHILSNPYTAAIDITKLNFGNDLDKTVYFYNTGSMAEWTTQTGSGNNPGQYIATPQDVAGIDMDLPSQIASMQGFLVMVTNPTPTSNTFGVTYNSAVTRNTEKQRVRAENKSTVEKVYTRINIAGEIYSDKMWIFSEPSCSHGYDNGWDGTKFLGTAVAPQLWAMEDNGDYQVNSVDDMNNTELGFIKGVDTTYTMTFTHNNASSKYSNIYLHDQATNTTTDITESGSVYTFIATSATAPINRFKITTNSGVITNTKEETTKQLRVYNSQQIIYVNNLHNCSGEMMIYDAGGRPIQSYLINSKGLTTIPTNLQTGTYVVKISTAKGNLSKQIIIQ